jgi:hypothetical protein
LIANELVLVSKDLAAEFASSGGGGFGFGLTTTFTGSGAASQLKAP